MTDERQARWRALVVPALLIAIGAALFLVLYHREPTYRGKSVSEWLEKIDEREAQGRLSQDPMGKPTEASLQSVEAIKKIGSNAVPYLIRVLPAADSPAKLWFKKVAEKQSLVRFHFSLADERRRKALGAVRVLGPAAASATPELRKLLKSGSISSRVSAAAVLGYIGPAAQEAVPELVKASADADQGVRLNATWALSQIAARPELSVPALINRLDDNAPHVRGNAIHGLARFGPNAKPAIPKLVECLHDPQRSAGAGAALVNIDREAARKAGIILE